MIEDIVENKNIDELVETVLDTQPIFSPKVIPNNVSKYFNQKWDKILFENPNKASDVFNFNIPEEEEYIYIDHKNLKNSKFDTLYMENNFANKLQFYYNYLDVNPQIEEKMIGDKTCKNILSLSPFYVQTVERLLMVMIFIHLDQCHDFLDSGRGASKYALNEYIYTDYDRVIRNFDYGEFESKEDTENNYPVFKKSSERAIEVYGAPKSPDISKNILVLENPCNNQWHQMSIRTSFCGGLSNYGIFLLEDQTFQLLKRLNYINENDVIDNNFLTELLRELPTIFVLQENSGDLPDGIEHQKNGGSTGFIISLDENGKIEAFETSKQEEMKDKPYIVRFLPFVSKNYDDGMHFLWEFNSVKHIYIVKLKQLKVQKYISYYKELVSIEKADPDNPDKKIKEKIGKDLPEENYRVYDPVYEASKFVTLDYIIPQQNIDIRPILQEIVGTTEREMKSICDFILNKYDDSQEEERNIAKEKYEKLINEVKNQVFMNSIQSLMRGVNYNITVPERTNYLNIIFNNILNVLFKTNLISTNKLFSPGTYVSDKKKELLTSSYDIVDSNSVSILEEINLINNSEESSNISKIGDDSNPPFVKNIASESLKTVLFNKQFAVINDTAAMPKEAFYITAMNNVKPDFDNKYDIEDVNYPFKFTIVSGTTDGSGQGGQITPTYHPPELDIYMPIFDENTGEFRGCILRICFLSSINQNRLNSVNKGIVENHFIYIDLVDDVGSTYTNDVSLYFERMELILNYGLSNSYLLDKDSNTSNFILSKSDGNVKNWYKYIGDDGLKVLTLNNYSQHLYTLFRIYKGSQIKIDGDVSGLSTIFTSSKREYCMLKQLHNVAVRLYNEDLSLRIAITPQTVDFNILKRTLDNFDDKLMNNSNTHRNFQFELDFILRNKYDGDKSRGTDTMFYNKSGFIEGFQITNDHNAFSSANIFSFDSLLCGKNYSTFYFAPYINNDNKLPISNSVYKETLLEGMSPSKNEVSGESYCDIMNRVKRQWLYTVPKKAPGPGLFGEVGKTERRSTRSTASTDITTGEAISSSASIPKKQIPSSEGLSFKKPAVKGKRESKPKASKSTTSETPIQTPIQTPIETIAEIISSTTTDKQEENTNPPKAVIGGERITDTEMIKPININYKLLNKSDINYEVAKGSESRISTKEDCEILYKINLIKILKLKSENIKRESSKLNDFVTNELRVNREKINNYNDFCLLLSILDVKNTMFYNYIPKVNERIIVNTFDNINNETSMSDIISIRNKYLFVIDKYDEIEYIDKYGVSYFYYTLNGFTSENEKYKYLPIYFFQWTNNVDNELRTILKYIYNYVNVNPENSLIFKSFITQLSVMTTIFTQLSEMYMDPTNIEKLTNLFLHDKNTEDIALLEDIYSLCLFLINLANQLKNEITNFLVGKSFEDVLDIPYSRDERNSNEYLVFTDDSIDYNNNSVKNYSNLSQITSFLSSNSNPIPNYLSLMINFKMSFDITKDGNEFIKSLYTQLIKYLNSQENNLSVQDNYRFKDCGRNILYNIFLQFSFLEDLLLEYDTQLYSTEKKALGISGGKTMKRMRGKVHKTRRFFQGNKNHKITHREKKYKNKKYTRR